MIRSLLLAAAIAGANVATIALPSAPATAATRDETPWQLPVTPPRCTTADANSGNVGHCLLAFYSDPSDTGWGNPPAPGVGAGWTWAGMGYNGSPALEWWEANLIAENAEPVAGLSAGRLETHVNAQALFEGFLREISAGGYRVRDAHGYSYRCTSGNGGWNCPSGNPDDLSNHAYGLAIDMNAGTNPIRNYTRIDGVTACQTPMATDMPRWVIQTAERWGLYWGGYGWNSGCADTSTDRNSVYRDPPHFEFRGTPAQAAAIAAYNLRNQPGAVCSTVVDESGADAERCNLSGRPEAGWRLPVQVAAPAGAEAVMINLTATEATAHGYLTLEDCMPRSGERETSALTFAPGENVASMAIVPLDDRNRFCIFRSAAVHSIVDVVGYLGAGGEPLWFEPTQPTRLTDTREQGNCAPFQECQPGPIPDAAIHAVPTEDDRPRIANIAAIDGAGPGYLQTGACERLGPTQNFSNLNYMGAGVRSNLTVMDGGDAGSCVFALRQAHVIVDELGRLDAARGYGWSLMAPERRLDTRECSTTWCGGRPTQGTVIEIDLGTTAPAAAIAITVTQTAGPGYISVGRCETFEGRDEPATSNLNHMANQTVTNLALVDLDNGRFCAFTRADAHVVIDLQAQLVDEQAVGLTPTDQTRIHDSREG